jgi:hypothetical protein
MKQKKMKKFSALSIFIVLSLMASFLFAAVARSADKTGSAAEGKVLDKNGRPLSGVTVVAELPIGEYRDGYTKIKGVTGVDGDFKLKELYPGTYYRIFFEGGQCNDPRERIRSLPTGETLKLNKDYVLLFSPFKVSPSGVIKDPRTGLEWAPVSMFAANYCVAETYATHLRLDGGGWRLPTIDELEGLYETGRRGCGLDWAFRNRFPNAWATDPEGSSERKIFDFLHGTTYAMPVGERVAPCDNCRVLPVRSPIRQSYASGPVQ